MLLVFKTVKNPDIQTIFALLISEDVKLFLTINVVDKHENNFCWIPYSHVLMYYLFVHVCTILCNSENWVLHWYPFNKCRHKPGQ